MAGDRRPRAVPLAVESRSSNCVEIDLVEMVYRSDTEGVPDSERAPAVASFGDCCLLMSALIAACNCVLSPGLTRCPLDHGRQLFLQRVKRIRGPEGSRHSGGRIAIGSPVCRLLALLSAWAASTVPGAMRRSIYHP